MAAAGCPRPMVPARDNALQDSHGGNGFAWEYKISRILCDRAAFEHL